MTTNPVAEARLAYLDARRVLADAIREACPAGHSHAYVQHRDGRPAWCEACGYHEDGTHRLLGTDAAQQTEETH